MHTIQPSRIARALLAFALLLPVIAWAAEAPTPSGTTLIDGQSVPMYTSKQILPTKSFAPDYPMAERSAGKDGQAGLAILVDEAGKVIRADIIESKPTASFGQSAQAAARKWRYPKLTQHGKGIRYLVVQPVLFSVDGR